MKTLLTSGCTNQRGAGHAVTARGNLGLTALGIGGNPTTLSTMDWQTQIFVVGGLYVVAAGGMTNTPTDLVFEDATTITMIRVVATDGTFLTCEVWPSTSTASKFRMYNVRFAAGTTQTRLFWVRQIFDNSGIVPVINGGTGATTAATARTNLGLGTASTYAIGTSGATVPLLSGTNTWTNNQIINGTTLFIGRDNTSTTNGGIELGSMTVAKSAFIDFHSSGTGSDYDVRMIASGGSATSGAGNFSITADTVSITKLALSTPLSLTSGGTGATTAASARTALGLGTSATYDIGTSGATVPLLSTVNTWSLAQTFNSTINVGATDSSSIIQLGNSSFLRDNGQKALIITSNSGSDGGSAGMYLRPMGDTTSTIQLFGNSTGWTFQGSVIANNAFRANGATTLAGTLATTGLATFNGSYIGNRSAIDLSGTTTNLNSCLVSSSKGGYDGVWFCATLGDGANITNKPTGVSGSFWLKCVSTRNNGVVDSGYVQTLYSYETSKSYIRYGKSPTSATAATWGSWQEQATLGNANNWTADQTFTGTNASVMINTSGGIEVAGATPYIDFHFTNTAADFNTRIINDANNTLSILAATSGVGRLRIDGGYQCKRGINGEFNANAFNYFWNTSSALELWVDAVNLGTVALNSTSDKGLKKDITYLNNKSEVLEEVKQWKPATFKYKARGGLIPESETKYGFIANDLATVSPDCVKGEGLPEDYDIEEDPNNPNAYSLDTVAMIAKLTQAIQEQQIMIEYLQAQINSNK